MIPLVPNTFSDMNSRDYRAFLRAPVIIGGVGGSGTRLIAEMLRSAGLEIGNDLNKALDNRHFQFVISKDTTSVNWSAARMEPYLQLFTSLQFGRGWNFRTFKTLYRTGVGHNPAIRALPGKLRHLRHVYIRARRTRVTPADAMLWGWKNPRTHLYLPSLNAYFPECRYIHVIRHGLDMAFSKNLNQLKYFGRHYGLQGDDPENLSPATQLEFWIRSNTRSVAYCREHMPERSLLLNYDRLCQDPAKHLHEVLQFTGLPDDEGTIAKLSALIKPTSTSRYKSQDLSQFTNTQLDAVRHFGFDIES